MLSSYLCHHSLRNMAQKGLVLFLFSFFTFLFCLTSPAFVSFVLRWACCGVRADVSCYVRIFFMYSTVKVQTLVSSCLFIVFRSTYCSVLWLLTVG